MCEELRSLACWPQLKRTFKVRLVSGQEGYDLPADFYSLLPFTQYDRDNSWLALGPLTDGNWNLRVYGTDLSGARRAFRLFGTGRQFKVDPLPEDGDTGSVISFDYMSRSSLQPPLWTASEASVAQNTYRSSLGIIYKKTNSGTHSGGTTRPTMEFGEGQDGGLRILALTTRSFSNSTLYAAGEYILESGRLYRVTVGGTSTTTAPTSTTEDTDISNGTLTLRYHTTPNRAGQTDYATGDYFVVGGTQYYRVEQGGKSGTDTPQWSATIFTDNTIQWTHQDMAYEVILSDSDLCVYDDELVIAGLRAKFFLSRGLGSADLVADYERRKKASAGRFNAGRLLDLASPVEMCGPAIRPPEGNWSF